MNVSMQNPATARIKQDGAGSVTAFAAVSGARWNLCGGMIGWANAINSCTISLYEIDSTNSAAFCVFMTSATSGMFSFYLGEIGVPASSSYTSRMVLNIGQTGTWSAMFSGYYTGA